MEGTSRPQNTEILEYPENYEDLKKKYLEREQEKVKTFELKHKVDIEKGQEVSSKSIKQRELRASSEHKPLKDRTIIREAKSEDIQDLKHQLNEEIDAIGRRIFKELPNQVPSLEKKVLGLRQLKGRISHNPPAA